MEHIILYLFVSFVNVFIHVVKTILVVKHNKMTASLSNCICYTFSAVVIKCIAETDLMIAIMVQAFTNFFGCYVAMWFCEKIFTNNKKENYEN